MGAQAEDEALGAAEEVVAKVCECVRCSWLPWFIIRVPGPLVRERRGALDTP